MSPGPTTYDDDLGKILQILQIAFFYNFITYSKNYFIKNSSIWVVTPKNSHYLHFLAVAEMLIAIRNVFKLLIGFP